MCHRTMVNVIKQRGSHLLNIDFNIQYNQLTTVGFESNHRGHKSPFQYTLPRVKKKTKMW